MILITFVAINFCRFNRSCVFADPEHQRAKGNLKYFEFQLEKQRKDAEEEEPPKETEKRVERDATEKKKKKKKTSESKISFQLIPERKKYEMLCRGEGIKMVRKKSI